MKIDKEKAKTMICPLRFKLNTVYENCVTDECMAWNEWGKITYKQSWKEWLKEHPQTKENSQYKDYQAYREQPQNQIKTILGECLMMVGNITVNGE